MKSNIKKSAFNYSLCSFVLISTIGSFPIVKASNGDELKSQLQTAWATSYDPWMTKPVLSYLINTQDGKLGQDRESLKSSLHLSEADMKALSQVGLDEVLGLKEIEINRQTVTPREFNSQADGVLAATDASVKQVLGNKYDNFRSWVKNWWKGERSYRNNQMLNQSEQNSIMPSATIGGSGSTVSIWATQYDAYTTYEAALPYVALKNAYASGGGYTVNLSRNTYAETVYVKEVGPWNTNDNYWDYTRNEFKDLPQYDQEAYEAYFNNYNGGYDDLGYKVLNQAGIDLSPAVASALGMGSGVSAYVNVDFSTLP